MTFSLILATVGSARPLGRFLEALGGQTYRRFELLVVDQNPDDRLEEILRPYRQRFPIVRLRSPRGLSRARNVGLTAARGDVLTFPDDDCWYPSDLLESAVRLLADDAWDGVCGRAVDAAGQTSAGMRWDRAAGPLTPVNVWRRAISFTVFLRRHVVEAVGPFDEELGLGTDAPWQSGEETDYLLRALAGGFQILYDPALAVCHDQPRRRAPATGYAYGMGMGRVLRKHGYPWWFVLPRILKPALGAAGSVIRADPSQARYQWAVACGRWRGWRG